MKILFATSSFKGGGITSYGKEVIENYSKDNDLSVLIGNDKASPITTQGVKVYYNDCMDLSVKNAVRTIDLINNTIKPEVILSSNAQIIPLIAPYLNDDIKIITVSHSLKYEAADMASVAHKHIDKIIAASSSYNKQYMIHRFGIKDSSKIDIILNFVSEKEDAEEFIKEKKERDEIRLVFAGANSSSKSPDVVIKVVISLIKTGLPFKFYWMGYTDIPLRQYFSFLKVNDIRDFVSDQRIIFPGRLPTREDAVNLISSANVFIAPSRREGCPMALLEAMRCGAIPIVADYGNANREIVRDGENGFMISHKDINAWVQRIEDIIKNHQRYHKYYDASYQTFTDRLCYKVWKEKMDAAIYSCGFNHVTRKKKVGVFCLRLRLLYFKMIKFVCRIEARLQEDVKVFLTFCKVKYCHS